MNRCEGPAIAAPALGRIATPLNVEAWAESLSRHPDRHFAEYINDGLRYGFRIGADRSKLIGPAPNNMPSALHHRRVVSDYIDNERRLGRMLGPFSPDAFASTIQMNRVGVIPKGQTGKWRLIMDLSYPPGRSVNDAIDPAHCSLVYTTVERVAQRAMGLGRGALLAKVDIEAAYRLVPVHGNDRPLLGLKWEGALYVDLMLPFGLRSAPKIFNAIADAIQWHVEREGVDHVDHYLDDFIVIGPPRSPQCQQALDTMIRSCAHLGVPLASQKTVGPTTCLTFLGITIDTLANELRLPPDKLTRLRSLLAEWGDRKVCNQRELESLIGLLNHACKVIRPGRSFLRRMLNLLKSPHVRHTGRRPTRHIRLNREFRSDLLWWRTFAEQWNGVAIAAPRDPQGVQIVTSDASGTWGCAAWSGQAWLQLRWDERSQHLNIAVKELIPIVMAATVWGRSWHGSRVACRCDNQAVVAVVNSRSSSTAHIMHMLRCLFFIEAHFNLQLSAAYISTGDNDIADDLSRNKMGAFRSKMPQADPDPTPIPPALPRLLLDPQMDWVSLTWTSLFSSIISTA